MHYIGALGVPQRCFALGTTVSSPNLVELNAAITVAALIVAAIQVVFFINVFKSLWKGEKADQTMEATSLEWHTLIRRPIMVTGADLPVVYRWAVISWRQRRFCAAIGPTG